MNLRRFYCKPSVFIALIVGIPALIYALIFVMVFCLLAPMLGVLAAFGDPITASLPLFGTILKVTGALFCFCLLLELVVSNLAALWWTSGEICGLLNGESQVKWNQESSDNG